MSVADRIFQILELYFDHDYELSISEISALSGLSPSVTHRIVNTLVQKGYLTQKEKRGKYSLGLKFLNFSNVINKNNKIIDIAMPFLFELSKKTNEEVLLGGRNKGDLLLIERIESNHDLRITSFVGSVMCLHSTAIGKMFLSQMPKSERQLVFNDKGLEKHTPSTITDFDKMEEELKLFEKEGCMYDREEHRLGIWGVAAPIYVIPGKIEAGLCMLVPTPRLNSRKTQKFSQLVKEYASRISQILS